MIEPAPLRVEPVVQEAMLMLRPPAEARQLRLEADLSVDLPMMLGDSTRLLQVFSNAVGNAIKFTPPGGRGTSVLDR